MSIVYLVQITGISFRLYKIYKITNVLYSFTLSSILTETKLKCHSNHDVIYLRRKLGRQRKGDGDVSQIQNKKAGIKAYVVISADL